MSNLQERLDNAKNGQWSEEALEVMEFMQDKSTNHYAEVMHQIMQSIYFIKGTPTEFTEAVKSKVVADLDILRLTINER